jgi:hypothetical protein
MPGYQIPRVIFFHLPFASFFEPIFSSISPKMEVDIKMISHYKRDIPNHKSHSLRCHRKAIMAIFKVSDMKTSRGPPPPPEQSGGQGS